MRRAVPLLLMLLLPAVAGAQYLMGLADPTTPQAPETFDTTYALPTGGTTWTPDNSAELVTALDDCVPGDVIVLAAGTTYTGAEANGSFVLENKGAGTDWIYIVSSAIASLPEGERVAMADATNMPTIISSNYQLPAIRTDYGAHHYRIAGVEIVTVPDNDILTSVGLGYGIPGGGTIYDFWDSPADTVEELPHHITFDRCLIHSEQDAYKLRHGIMLNGYYLAVLDSYIANCKDGSDAQAIWIYNGDGPFKIINNFLEATGENFMVGGTDPTISNCIPADIEFRRNYCFKRLDWKTNPSPNWSIKNLFELKNCQRVLVSGNVMENCWADAQAGMAVLFTVRNQSGTAPWSVVQDINFENNIIKNVGQGLAITGEDDEQSSQQTKRVRVHNNLFENVTVDYATSPGFFALSTVTDPILNVTITHNTCVSATDEDAPYSHIILASGSIPVDGFVLKDNVLVHGKYPPSWSQSANMDSSNNALIMISANSNYAENKAYFTTWHPGWTMIDPDFAAAEFVNSATGDWHADTGSPLENAASDGTDIGADIDTLETATAGAISGTW